MVYEETGEMCQLR